MSLSQLLNAKTSLAFILLGLFCMPTNAQDFVGTRALGLAESYRAIATGNDAIYFNPAGVGQIQRYSPELHYKFNLEAEDHQFDASVVDSKTSAFGMGLAYTFQGREFTRRTTLQHTATLASSYTIFPKLFSVGVGLKYVNISDAIVGNYLNALSGDIGLLATLPGGVNLAAVGYNLIPIRTTDSPLSAAFALAWDLGPLSALIFGPSAKASLIDPSGALVPVNFGSPSGPLDNVTLTVDWNIDFLRLEGAKSRVSTGLEFMLFDAVPLRTGYRFDEKRGDHAIAVGGGFIVPYFGLDLGYMQSITDPDERTFGASLKFFLDL